MVRLLLIFLHVKKIFSLSFFSRIFFLFPLPNLDLPLKLRATLTLAARIGFVLINLSFCFSAEDGQKN